MKIFREVKGIPEPPESEEGKEKKENRIAMRPVEGIEQKEESDIQGW